MSLAAVHKRPFWEIFIVWDCWVFEKLRFFQILILKIWVSCFTKMCVGSSPPGNTNFLHFFFNVILSQWPNWKKNAMIFQFWIWAGKSYIESWAWARDLSVGRWDLGICEKVLGPGEARTHDPRFTSPMPWQKSYEAYTLNEGTFLLI